MIKAIIFDLDGTLLDSSLDIKNSLNKVLKDNNLKELTLKQVEKYLGYGSYNLVKDALTFNNKLDIIDKVYKEYIEYYPKNSNIHTKPYDDIMQLIKKLKKDNYKIAIASNKMNNAVLKLNDEVFNNVFDIAVGEGGDIRPKPKADMLLYTIDELNLKNNDVLYIGDTEVDLLTARNANIKSVAVTWGFRSKEFLLNEKYDYMIEKPLDLLLVLKNIK